MPEIKTLVKEFWKHASSCGKCDTVENILFSWANGKDITINQFYEIYKDVNATIDSFFKTKTAIQLSTEEFLALTKKEENPAAIPSPENFQNELGINEDTSEITPEQSPPIPDMTQEPTMGSLSIEEKLESEQKQNEEEPGLSAQDNNKEESLLEIIGS